MIEGNAKHGRQTSHERLDLPGGIDLEDLGGAAVDREDVEIPDVKIAVKGDRRWDDMPLAG